MIDRMNQPKDSISPSTEYRPDIDGLRALAVMLVIGFHGFPATFPNGFIGVDIFFVISGFLISSVILNDLNHSQFSLVNFYAKRCLRIFPALLTLLIFVLALGYILLLPSQFSVLANHIQAGATFTSNFQLWRDSGYFDRNSELKPLLHLWSLAVEEQFYLIWPLILMMRKQRRALIWAILLGSLALDLSLTNHHQPFA